MTNLQRCVSRLAYSNFNLVSGGEDRARVLRTSRQDQKRESSTFSMILQRTATSPPPPPTTSRLGLSHVSSETKRVKQRSRGSRPSAFSVKHWMLIFAPSYSKVSACAWALSCASAIWISKWFDSRYHSPFTDSSLVHCFVYYGLRTLHRIAVPKFEMDNNNSGSWDSTSRSQVKTVVYFLYSWSSLHQLVVRLTDVGYRTMDVRSLFDKLCTRSHTLLVFWVLVI